MSRLTIRSTILALAFGVAVPSLVQAHAGPPMDRAGCHRDHRENNYHCHRGEMDGLYFRSKSDMLDMRKNGTKTAIDPPEGTPLGDILGGGRRKTEALDKKGTELESRVQALESQLKTGEPAAPAATRAPSTVAPTASAATPFPAQATEMEDRLFRLKRLYQKGLITEEEYDAKRQEILDTL